MTAVRAAALPEGQAPSRQVVPRNVARGQCVKSAGAVRAQLYPMLSCRPPASVCRVRPNEEELGPTELDTRHSWFLLSFGRGSGRH